MKPSNGKENKDKIIETIKEFFDSKFIEDMSKLTKFVQRESKVQGVIFFSLCVYSKERWHHKPGRFM